jgi:hypothetical protein
VAEGAGSHLCLSTRRSSTGDESSFSGERSEGEEGS